MAERSVLVRLMASVDSYKAAMREAANATKGVGDQADKSTTQASTALGRMAKSAQDNRQAWDTAGTALAGFGAVTTVALGGAIKAAVDWESAWAGVTKTLPGDADFAATERGLRELARTLPATHTEIAAVAEAAGQLGVAADAIVPFTKTMIDLGETTNLSAEEAATSIAQLMNVMRTAPEDVGRLGAALVELGNNGASTEGDIIRMAQRISGAGALVGASEADVLALASAMADVGIQSELGGGVMTRVLQEINSATIEGGDSLAGFAEVAGMSSEEFARAWEADPIRAVAGLVKGLDGVDASGGNVVQTLSDLGLKGTEEASVLLRLMGASDKLVASLDTSNTAWQQNTALVEEASKRYDTTASQLAIAKNNIVDAGIEIGEALLPVLADVAGAVADVAGWFADLPDPVQGAVTAFAGIAGVGTLAAGAFLLVFPRVVETYEAFKLLGGPDGAPRAASALGAVGKAAGIAGAIYAVATAADALAESFAPGVASVEATTAALLTAGESLEQVNALFRENDAGLGAAGMNGLADAAARLTDPGLVGRFDDFTAELLSLGSAEGRDQRERVIEQLGQLGQSLALMVESGNAEMAAQQFDVLAAEWERGGGTVENLRELMPAYGEALKAVENQQKLAGDSANGMAEGMAAIPAAAESAGGAVRFLGDTAGMSTEQIDEAVKAVEAWHESMAQTAAAFLEPLNAYKGLLQEKTDAERAAADATAATNNASIDEQIEALRRRTQAELDALGSTDANAMEQRRIIEERRDVEIDALEAQKTSYEDYVDAVTVSLGEYADRLAEQNAAQEEWRDNIVRVAGWAGTEVAQILFEMGEEGKQLTADMADGTSANAQRMADELIRDARFGGQGAAAELDMAMKVMEIAGRDGAGATARAIAEQLGIGVREAADIAARYGVSLASGINPVLGALGRREIHLATGRGFQAADGAIFDFYANGGVRENHVAQIARPGDWRVWAEPETGGEAYIPLAPAKRDRSLDIWRETGRRLSAPEAKYFADGGITGGYVRYGSVSEPEWRNLLAAGWQGRAGDGMEALYPPSEAGGWVPPKPPSTAPFQPPISSGADASMEKLYDEVTAWMGDIMAAADAIANQAAVTIGGGGNLAGGGGMVQRLYATIRAAFPRAKLNSGLRPGDPGYHGLGRAVDLGEMGFAGGTGRPYLGDMAAWIYNNFGAETKELIYTGAFDRTPDLKNGRVLNYGGATNAAHRNHVHWAMARGGILNPHVRDTGGPLLPGYTFNGTGGNETVVNNRYMTDASSVRPAASAAAPSLVGVTIQGRVTIDGDGIATIAGRVLEQSNATLARDVRSALS